LLILFILIELTKLQGLILQVKKAMKYYHILQIIKIEVVDTKSTDSIVKPFNHYPWAEAMVQKVWSKVRPVI